MNIRHSLVTSLAALALAAVPASAIPYGFTFSIPTPPSSSCDEWSLNLNEGGGENGPLYSSNSWFGGGMSFGCMGSQTNSPGGYVMIFGPSNGPSFHCNVTWQNEDRNCPKPVPDNGSTLALLGVSLVGVAALRRRRFSGAPV